MRRFNLETKAWEDDEAGTLPKGITARQFLGLVMCGEIDPPPKQINAAKVLIEYEEPKLSAVAVGHMDQSSFASALERAIERSKGPPRQRRSCLPCSTPPAN